MIWLFPVAMGAAYLLFGRKTEEAEVAETEAAAAAEDVSQLFAPEETPMTAQTMSLTQPMPAAPKAMPTKAQLTAKRVLPKKPVISGAGKLGATRRRAIPIK